MTSPLEYMFAAARVPLSGIVLDAACGRGQFGLYIRAQRDDIELIGGEIWPESILQAKIRHCYDHLIRCDILHLPFQTKSVDMAFGIEVIEHQDKKNGYRLMNELENTASIVLLTTPNGFLPQDNKHKGDNPYQIHKSGWKSKDFRKLGYKVRGIPEYREGISRFFIPLFLSWNFLLGAKSLISIKNSSQHEKCD